MITGYILGVIYKIILFVKDSSNTLFSEDNSCTKKEILGVAKEYREFPAYNFPAGFIYSFIRNVPILMLGYIYTPVIVGLYAMANRVVQLPAVTTEMAIRRVFLQHISARKNEVKEIKGSLLKSNIYMSLIGVVPFGVLWLYGSEILSFYLGSKREIAGRYAELLSP